MKKILALLIILISYNAYTGPIREGIVWEVEKLLLYVPKNLMSDKDKGYFLKHLHKEITDKDELTIMQSYVETSEMVGLTDPVGLVEYVKSKDEEALKKFQDQMKEASEIAAAKIREKEAAENKPKNKVNIKDLKEKMDRIKEAREYGEELLNTD